MIRSTGKKLTVDIHNHTRIADTYLILILKLWNIIYSYSV